MILERDFKGAMRLDRSKDVRECLNLHQLRFQSIKGSCVEFMLIRRVCLLGKNASDTCALLTEAYRGEVTD
jgi:hypothetical protein